jgi:hypothetical protein
MFKLKPTEETCNLSNKLSFEINDVNSECGDASKFNFDIKDGKCCDNQSNIVCDDVEIEINGNLFLEVPSGNTINVTLIDKDNNIYNPYVTNTVLRIAKERRSDFVSPYSYVGYSQYLSDESANVWRVARITVLADGTTTVGVATNVNWTDRYTHTYT